MGYRLTITDEAAGQEFTGTKLFGYVPNTDALPSCRYLIELGKCSPGESWTHPFKGNITLNAQEFREFIRLYDIDFQGYAGYPLSNAFDHESLDKIIASKEDKLLYWD